MSKVLVSRHLGDQAMQALSSCPELSVGLIWLCNIIRHSLPSHSSLFGTKIARQIVNGCFRTPKGLLE